MVSSQAFRLELDNKTKYVISAGKEEKVIEKAISKAVAQFHSKKKKAKNPKQMLKNKANALIINENSKLWCPK